MLQVRKIIKSRGFKNLITVFLIFSLVIGGVFVASPRSAYATDAMQSQIYTALMQLLNCVNSALGNSQGSASQYNRIDQILQYCRLTDNAVSSISSRVTSDLPSIVSNTNYLSNLSLSWTPNNDSSGNTRTVYKGTSLTLDGTYDTSSKNGSDIYVKFNMGTALSSLLVRIDLWNLFRYSGYTTHSFELFYDDNGTYLSIPITAYYNNGYLFTGVYPEGFKSGDIILHISIDHSYTWRSATSIDVSYLDNAKLSTWIAKNTISTMSIEKMLYDLHRLNYDDASMQAKAESQEVIDDTLENFAGNGSASVKKADTSSAKDTSNALRTGLSTGGNSSDTFEVFNITSDFFRFFSQDCYDYVNGVSDLPVRNYSSGFRSSIGEFYPDFLTDLDLEYQERITHD